MEPFDLAQSFIEYGTRPTSIETLTAAFRDALEQLGFRHFACCSHVDPSKPPRRAVMVHTYPSKWAQTFSERRLYEIDPVLLRAERTFLPFFWDSPEFRAQLTKPQREILREAASMNLIGGYTIPIHMPWMPGVAHASCSVVPDAPSVRPVDYFCAQLMAMYLCNAVSREPQMPSELVPRKLLSARERQCLELVAQGKSDWIIGQILRISEHTVHRLIESAKQRLGVATRMQAVISAAQEGQISIGDAVRADPSLTRPASYSDMASRTKFKTRRRHGRRGVQPQ
jgi:DNA-binding CsgD family transcriptional regulator